MPGEWLNRVGIMLDLVAGFMVAPELIGFDRISRAEEWLETRIRTSRLAFQRVKWTFHTGELPAFDFHVLFAALIAAIFWMAVDRALHSGLYFRWIGIAVAALYTIYGAIWWWRGRAIRGWLPLRRDEIPPETVGSFAEFLWFTLIGLPLLAVYTFSFLLAYPLEKCLAWLLKNLEAKEALRSVLVTFGIVFFIVGNLLQLIATFLGPTS